MRLVCMPGCATICTSSKWPQILPGAQMSGTEKVFQRTRATKILLNFRVNLLVRHNTLVLLGSALELSRKIFGAVRAIFGFGVLFEP